MSVLIKGMEMPDCCVNCYFSKMSGKTCTWCELIGGRAIPSCEVSTKRMDDCPLVEIPTPHGRLIEERVIRDIIDEVTFLEEADPYTLALITEKLNHDYDFGVVIEAED